MQVRCNPHFCPAIFVGIPTWRLPSQPLRIQNDTNKKALTVPGRQRIDHKWVPSANSQVTIQISNSYKCFFSRQTEFGKEGTTWKFRFLSWASTTLKIWESWLWYEFSLFAGFCQFSQDPICRLWSKCCIPMSLILVTRQYRGGKIFFPLFLKSTWLRSLILYDTWWMDKFI